MGEKRPADKIMEGLTEALAIARGEAEPYKLHVRDLDRIHADVKLPADRDARREALKGKR